MNNRMNLARWVIYIGAPLGFSILFTFPKYRTYLVSWYPFVPHSPMEDIVAFEGHRVQSWGAVDLSDDDD